MRVCEDCGGSGTVCTVCYEPLDFCECEPWESEWDECPECDGTGDADN